MKSIEGYVVDTSSFIDLNRYNPIDLYPSVWRKIETLIRKELLVSHEEVYNELLRQDDEVAKWAKNNKNMFKPITKRQVELIKRILSKFPSLIDPKREYDADPWIIALAIELSEINRLYTIKWLVVTEERLRGNKIKIPLVCEYFNIKAITIFEMFRRMGWSF